MITEMTQVYDFVQQTIKKCREQERFFNIAIDLENALSLGSSGLEILGAIGKILSEERHKLEEASNSP